MERILTIPDNVQVNETARSYYWFDEEGLMYSVGKKNAPQASIPEMKKLLDEFVAAANGKKFCILSDVTHSTPNNKETREFVAKEFPKIVTALAMVSASPLGRMVANLFFALKPTPYPAKMFDSEAEAKQWLKQYL